MGCIVANTLLKAAKEKEWELKIIKDVLSKGEQRQQALKKKEIELTREIASLKTEAYGEML